MRISDWSSDVCSPIFRALVGGGRELAFGEAVHAVVHDDVDHVHAPPHDVGELAEADRGAVAIAGDAEIDQLAVGEVGAGPHARHAAVHGVAAVAGAKEVGRCLDRNGGGGGKRVEERVDPGG